MIPLWLLIGILALVEVLFLVYNLWYNSRLAAREIEMDKHEVSLDERERSLKEDILAMSDMTEATPLKASYVVTESDEMKYTSAERIKRNAKKQIAFTIANDIVNAFEPEESETAEGRHMFTYKFKIKQ